MAELETISQVIERLHKRGYAQDFRALEANFHITPAGLDVEPDQVVVDAIYRFEGETNLDDEAVIFALSCPQHNCKGTYIVAFGPMMEQRDSIMVQRLNKKKMSNK
ncbi:MAG: hypothetical protein KC505_01215 [Myxococcales bacterium]|nr:hypothetical protein [Myxococcales bacterium]USN51476.1 MAG: hypothetical protein H6731_03450 [Myxococcales bacterium]